MPETAGLAPAGPAGLTVGDFDALTQLFYDRTGIRFTPNKRYFVDKRVLQCMRESHVDDVATYLTALRLGTDPAVMQRLVNALTVNESYFLREDHQFTTLVRHVLPDLVRTMDPGAPRPVRILSLPCSTGDEAYSIALTLFDSWRDLDTVDVEIVGADIDTATLSRAREGVFAARAVQRIPRSMLDAYFEPIDRGFQIRSDLRDAIRFERANIVDARTMAGFRSFDVIFCRNLLIYFDDVSSRIAVGNLYDSLRPGGYLFLGHAESMSRIANSFTPLRLGEGIVYRKTR